MPFIRPEDQIKQLLIYYPRFRKRRDEVETFYLQTAQGQNIKTAQGDNILWTI